MSQRKKTGGRRKGTPNRITRETREILKEIVNNELDELSDSMATLDTKDRAELIIKLLPYILPKYQMVEVGNDTPQEERGRRILNMIAQQQVIRDQPPPDKDEILESHY